MKQNRALEETKNEGSGELKSRDKEITNLNEQIRQLKLELDGRSKEATAAEANAAAQKEQTEGFIPEYDCLLEDSKNLQNQLQSIDLRLSHSGSKKNP